MRSKVKLWERAWDRKVGGVDCQCHVEVPLRCCFAHDFVTPSNICIIRRPILIITSPWIRHSFFSRGTCQCCGACL